MAHKRGNRFAELKKEKIGEKEGKTFILTTF